MLLAGTLPANLLGLASMTISVRNNSFKGSLSESWINPTLTLLDISDNELTGSLPAAWGAFNVLPSLQYFSMDGNYLTGEYFRHCVSSAQCACIAAPIAHLLSIASLIAWLQAPFPCRIGLPTPVSGHPCRRLFICVLKTMPCVVSVHTSEWQSQHSSPPTGCPQRSLTCMLMLMRTCRRCDPIDPGSRCQ